MPLRLRRLLIALSGIAGVVMLTAHFFIPSGVPADTESAAQVMRFVTDHRDAVLFTAWLQGVGPLFYVGFAIAVAHLAGATTRLSGLLTLLASAVILALSLIDAAFTISATEAAAAGHAGTAVASFDLIAGPANDAVGRVFLLAPPLLLPLGAAILASNVLPRRTFGYTAVVFGASSIALGLAQLFSTTAFNINLYLIIAQNIWVLAAAVTLAATTSHSDRVTASGPL